MSAEILFIVYFFYCLYFPLTVLCIFTEIVLTYDPFRILFLSHIFHVHES